MISEDLAPHTREIEECETHQALGRPRSVGASFLQAGAAALSAAGYARVSGRE